MSDTSVELLALNQRLLDSIAQADWKTYTELCDASLTCFEPEARSSLVAGLDFHRYYFELPKGTSPKQTTICAPHLRVMGDTAVICYLRLVQHLDAAGAPVTARFEETRVWQKQNGQWRHVHFHRSAGA